MEQRREVQAACEPGDVEVGIDEVGELLKGGIQGRRHDAGVGVQHLVALEQPVGVDAEHVAVGTAETVTDDRLNRSGDPRGAVVDLVAVERPASQPRPRGREAAEPHGGALGGLAREVGGGDREQSRPTADPSTPAGSSIATPSICRPPQIPSTGRPDAAALTTASAMPVDRIHARSLGTCLEPGSTTRSAPVSPAGVRAQQTSATCWSRTNSSRLEA